MKKKMTHSEAGKLGSEAVKKIHEEKYKQRIAEYDKNPKRCLHCNKAISYKKRRNNYCSHSCVAIANNLNGNINEKTILICPNCNKYFIKTQYKVECCSDNCRNEYRDKIFIKKGKSGELRENSLRRYILKTREYKCEIPTCGISEWKGKPAPLEVDHIDGNSENNMPENIRLICANCHAQTPTHRAKNRGKGRPNRYKNKI